MCIINTNINLFKEFLILCHLNGDKIILYQFYHIKISLASFMYV
jgi:hypothetical protein